ncbi:hypothetical protein SISNIDRAFT_458740, partial [Sistotremastrum niveocremeum HHB9708]
LIQSVVVKYMISREDLQRQNDGPKAGSSYFFAWSYPSLCHGVPGNLITTAYRFDCHNYLSSSPAHKALFRAILEPVPPALAKDTPAGLTPGVFIPSINSIPKFPSPYYDTAMCALIVSYVLALCYAAKKGVRNQEWYAFPSLVVLFQVPIILASILVSALIKDQVWALVAYREQWNVDGWNLLS